jgi:hypothetical protein
MNGRDDDCNDIGKRDLALILIIWNKSLDRSQTPQNIDFTTAGRSTGYDHLWTVLHLGSPSRDLKPRCWSTLCHSARKLRLRSRAWKLFLADRVTDLRQTTHKTASAEGKSCHDSEHPCERMFRRRHWLYMETLSIDQYQAQDKD